MPRDETALAIERYRRIVVLTGAGISVASGLPTFRGPGGLWENDATAAASDVSALEREPASVWRLFGAMRAAVQAAAPNAAHASLAALERRLAPGRSLTVLTQNVDGLHQRAGSRAVVELHGNVTRTRCSDTACEGATPREDARPYSDDATVPRCERCGAVERPDVVLFGEPIPVDDEWAAKKALRECDLFIAVGTSGTVSPASNFVRSAEYEGALTVLINLEPMQPRNPAFRREILGRAEEVLPRLLCERVP